MRSGTAFFLLAVVAGTVAAAPFTRTFESSLQTRVGFDSNPVAVSGTSAALLGDEDVLTYAAGVNLGLGWSGAAPAQPSLKLTYAGEILRFDGRGGENFSTHRFGTSGQFTAGAWKVTGDASSLLIAGSRDTLASVATVNANGTALWRERRAQWQHRAKVQALAQFGAGVIRATGTVLSCDYLTHVVAGRVTFADRYDVQGGLDAGWKRNASSLWFAGIRAGHQEQEWVPLPNCAFDYSNNYLRLAVGWEGKLPANTTLAFAAGPDFRRYNGATDPRVFLDGPDRTSSWFEASVSSKPSPRLTLTGKATRMNWLSSTGKSAYIDTCMEAAAAWTLSPALTARLTAKVHRCDYFPVYRDDWESLVGVGTSWKLSARTTLTADLLRHEGWNGLSGLPEREFRRMVCSLGVAVKL